MHILHTLMKAQSKRRTANVHYTYVILICVAFLFLTPCMAAVQPEPLAEDAACGSGQMVSEPVFNSALFLEEFGKENTGTVILVHGAGDLGPAAMEAPVTALTATYHVIRFDLPGFGCSEKSSALYSPANYARLLKWLIDTYATRPIYLVGHSMGGAISLYFVGTYPDAVDRLILVDAAGILHRAAFTKETFNNRFAVELNIGEKNVIEKPLSVLKYFVGTTIETLDNNKIADNLDLLLEQETFRQKALGGDPEKIAAMAMIYTDFSDTIANARVPTCMIWGEKDTTAPLRTGYMLASTLSHASLTILSGLGHSPMLDDPERFNTALLQAISESKIDSYPKITKPYPMLTNLPSKTIDGKENMEVSGYYDSITVTNAKQITIADTFAKKITIVNSEVALVNTMVESDEIAIDISDAIVCFTGVHAQGLTAVHAKNSSVDIAGSVLKGKEYSITSTDKNHIVFSISKIESPVRTGKVHTVVTLHDGENY